MSAVEALKVATELMDALIAYIEPIAIHGRQADALLEDVRCHLLWCCPLRKRVIELRQARAVLAAQRTALKADEMRRSVEQSRKGLSNERREP